VKNADEEMKALDSADLRRVAILQSRYAAAAGAAPVYDSTASITWVDNQNDLVSYKSKAASNQFAVFSEIYYDKGWNAYIDGKLTPYVKVNYVLRGMPVPAGEHTIEFRFEPKVVATSKLITSIAAVIVFLLLGLAGWLAWKEKGKAVVA
jgi:uncharacterized membrane protein YfhO